MRNCPVCGMALEKVALQGEEVDRCSSCNGIFFDKGELSSIVSMIRLFVNVKLDEEDIDTIHPDEWKRELACPEDGQIMTKRDFGGHVIDVCSQCEGIWLDDREIALLRWTEDHIKQNLQLYIRLGQ